MSKGIEWWTFILFVILLVIVLFSIFSLVHTNFNPLNAPEAVALDQAIACSYLRCIEGCASPKIIDTDTLQCRSEFCNSDWTDTKKADGKICGENAKAHPVVATVASSGGEVVEALKIQEITGYAIRSDESGDNCAAGPNSYLAYIDNTKSDNIGLYVLQKDKCDNIIGCENILVGGPITYYVWTETSSNILTGSQYNIIVCAQQHTPVTATPGCGDAGGNCRVGCYENEEHIAGTCGILGKIPTICCKAKS